MLWRLKHRKVWGSFLSVLVCMVAMVLLCMRESQGYFSPSWETTPGPTGVYSKDRMETVPSETLQLVEDKPSEFWNCKLRASPCRYFYPYRFYQQDAAEFQEHYKELGGGNRNLPAMTALSWSSMNAESLHSVSLPFNLSFIHCHKSGGTTVKTLLAQTRQRLEKTINTTAKISNYKYSFGGGSSSQKKYNEETRQYHIEAMVKMPPSQALVFSVIRDPLDRFVSAVQQVMHYNDDFRRICLKRTKRSTLECSIQYAKKTQYLRDVHMVPMATHFRLWDQHEEARIAILHIQDLPSLAKYLGVVTNQTNTDTMPHARDRSQVNYATSKVLANMRVADCSRDMIQELCQLYAIDVVLLKSLGFNSTYCP